MSKYRQRKQRVKGNQYNAGRDIIISQISRALIVVIGVLALAVMVSVVLDLSFDKAPVI